MKNSNTETQVNMSHLERNREIAAEQNNGAEKAQELIDEAMHYLGM